MHKTWTEKEKNVVYAFPDDAEAHFRDIQQKIAKFRTFPMAIHPDGYPGPWLENIFINDYFNHSLHTYHGLIPIFAAWLDTQIQPRQNFEALHAILKGVLRPNVLYFTISWGDEGLMYIQNDLKNIFVFSSGGYGHVACPEIKGNRLIYCHSS